MKIKRLVLLEVFLFLAIFAVPGISNQSYAEKGQNMAAEGFGGTVKETMNSGGYTYVLVDDGKEKRWAATSEFEVKTGDRVIVASGTPMKGFYSKTLNRKFEKIYFVSRISKMGEKPETGSLPKGHFPVSTKKTSAQLEMDFSGIQKPKGGKTVAEIYAERKALADKEVLIRGKVVRAVLEVMGQNWFHLQDGTGEKGSNDLTVLTNVEETANVGDTVLVRGRVILDKDFGSGYRYDILIVDGKITLEP